MKPKFLLLLLLTISCKSQESNLYEIDPRTFDENKITLAEIADDIIYIPLDNSFPIGIIYSYKITDKSIYLSAKDISILAFNRDGKMPRKIGSRGRGPGEYGYGLYFAVDDKTGTIYVLDYSKIKVYSKNGNFLRDILLKEYGGGRIEFFDSKLFFPDFLESGNSKYNWIILDTLGNLINKKENSIPPFPNNMGVGGSIYKFQDRIFYYNYFNDTIFSILPDLSWEAAFLFSPGEHRWPRSKLDVTQLSPYMSPVSLFETDCFIVFHYGYHNRGAFALIDKKNKKTFLAYLTSEVSSSGVTTHGGFLNNLDGGMPFQPDKYYTENDQEYMIAEINPYQLKDHVASSEFKNSAPEYPEKKTKLEKLANSLNENDNPILILVKLKK